MLWALFAPWLYGLALIREGKPAQAIAPLKASIAFWEATGGKLNSPSQKAHLANAVALTGNLENALLVIEEAIAQIERPGWEERYFYAEILRLKGWMFSLQGDIEGAERKLSRLARLGPAPAREIVGAAHLDQPGTPMAEPR